MIMRSLSAFRAFLILLLIALGSALVSCGGGVNSPGAISDGQPDPGIALTQVRFKTPPMGWNSWNTFGCTDTEAIIKSVADAIASNGMGAAGYEYVTVDDCWVGGRNPTTEQLYSNATTFPDGIQALAAYVHSKGLKFGLYTSGGTNTCAGLAHGMRPPSYPPGVGAGSLGHESVDAQTFANWGVDYIKLDYCGGSLTAFPAMRAGITATGRTMFLSINPYSANTTLTTNFAADGTLYVPVYADMSRISQDISAKFTSVTSIIDTSAADVAWAVPGYFNDMDMLEVGNGMTEDQDTAHFIMWAIMSSGLNAGNDVRSQSAATQALLTNTGVISVNQDALALQAVSDTVDSSGSLQVWTKPLATNGTRAVALLNRGATAAPITVNFSNLGLGGSVQATNLVTGANLGTVTKGLTETVPATGAVLLKLTGTDPAATNGPLALQSWVWSAVQSGAVAVKVFPAGSPLPTGASATGAVVVHGASYEDGMTLHAPAQIVYRLNGKCTTFQSDIGLDAAANGAGTVDYQVWADDVELYDSGLVTSSTATKTVRVGVAGRNTLRLVITDGATGVTNDVADWANPTLVCS